MSLIWLSSQTFSKVEDEKRWSYKSGNKCLSVLAFVDPIPPQFGSGTGTRFIFSHRKSGVVDRVISASV
jgi:hypothetical protein